jgi:hypothetical protein
VKLRSRHTLPAPALALSLATFGFASSARAQDPPAPPPEAPDAQPSPYGGMQSGGLTPPPPMAEGQAHSDTEQQLDEAKKRDARRGLSWIWIDATGGFEHVGLTTFSADAALQGSGLVPTDANGGLISGALGLRLVFLTIGARVNLGFFSPWQLFTVGGEVGLHIPLGKIEPHVDLGSGYAGIGNVGGALSSTPGAISIRGFYVRAGVGLDYYVAKSFSIGVNGTFELLGLTRPGVDATTLQTLQAHNDINATEAAALKLDGSSYGSAFAFTGVAALHF